MPIVSTRALGRLPPTTPPIPCFSTQSGRRVLVPLVEPPDWPNLMFTMAHRADLVVALESARAGAAVIREYLEKGAPTRFKGDADPVTEADERAERSIRLLLSRDRADDAVVAEEEGGTVPDAGRVWLVDPLDGTTNFIHGFPWISVSVALWIDNIPTVGVVINATNGDEYVAVRGEGALLNGSPIKVSTTPELSEALVVTGFPYNRGDRTEICQTRFVKVLAEAQGVRRLGSAALDLCMVACGRMDAYWEEDLSPWDMGAGVLMVLEAGGAVTDLSGYPVGPTEPFVIAGNPPVHQSLLAILKETRSLRLNAPATVEEYRRRDA